MPNCVLVCALVYECVFNDVVHFKDILTFMAGIKRPLVFRQFNLSSCERYYMLLPKCFHKRRMC